METHSHRHSHQQRWYCDAAGRYGEPDTWKWGHNETDKEKWDRARAELSLRSSSRPGLLRILLYLAVLLFTPLKMLFQVFPALWAGFGCEPLLDVDQRAAASASGTLLPCSLDRLNRPVQTHRQHARTHWLSSIHHSLFLRAAAKLTDSTREGEEAQKNQAAKMTARLCALPKILLLAA